MWNEVMKVRVLCKLSVRALPLVLGVTWDPGLCISGRRSLCLLSFLPDLGTAVAVSPWTRRQDGTLRAHLSPSLCLPRSAVRLGDEVPILQEGARRVESDLDPH